MNAWSDTALADRAVSALLDELDTYPKPGLVSRVDSGAHADMDYDLMLRSAESLRAPFVAVAGAGRAGASFRGVLVPLGIEAERTMLAATGGVNTHRGALFTLGLLVAAMARAGQRWDARAVLVETWGAELAAHAEEESVATHGAKVRRDLGAGGVRAEASRGFPSVFDLALPAWRAARAAGLPSEAARVETLFVLMQSVEDTNVLFRGGRAAAAHVRAAAAGFLEQGGCRAEGWFGRAEQIHRDFVRRNISPGGCADLLAAAMLLEPIAD